MFNRIGDPEREGCQLSPSVQVGGGDGVLSVAAALKKPELPTSTFLKIYICLPLNELLKSE